VSPPLNSLGRVLSSTLGGRSDYRDHQLYVQQHDVQLQDVDEQAQTQLPIVSRDSKTSTASKFDSTMFHLPQRQQPTR